MTRKGAPARSDWREDARALIDKYLLSPEAAAGVELESRNARITLSGGSGEFTFSGVATPITFEMPGGDGREATGLWVVAQSPQVLGSFLAKRFPAFLAHEFTGLALCKAAADVHARMDEFAEVFGELVLLSAAYGALADALGEAGMRENHNFSDGRDHVLRMVERRTKALLKQLRDSPGRKRGSKDSAAAARKVKRAERDARLHSLIITERNADLAGDAADAVSIQAWNDSATANRLAKRLAHEMPEVKRSTLERNIGTVLTRIRRNPK